MELIKFSILWKFKCIYNKSKKIFCSNYKNIQIWFTKTYNKCNVTNSTLRENSITSFDFTIPRWEFIRYIFCYSNAIYMIQYGLNQDRNITPGGCTTANPTCSSGPLDKFGTTLHII